MNTMKELNELAFTAMNDNMDCIEAEKIFRLNAEVNPCAVTYNNLAWLLFERDFNTKQAEQYVKKALEYARHLNTLRIQSEILLRNKKYKEAVPLQLEILECSNGHYYDLYNTGLVYFQCGDYMQAKEYFDKAYGRISSNHLERIYFLETYAVCLAKSSQTAEANRIADTLLYNYLEESEYEINVNNVFIIYYFAGNYKTVLQHGEHLYKDFALNETSAAILLWSYKNVHPEEPLKEFFDDMLARIIRAYKENECESHNLVKRLKRIYREIENNNQPEPAFFPRKYYRCNYFGCTTHNTGYGEEEDAANKKVGKERHMRPYEIADQRKYNVF